MLGAHHQISGKGGGGGGGQFFLCRICFLSSFGAVRLFWPILGLHDFFSFPHSQF